MSSTKKGSNNNMYEGEMELRRGPWTLEEDTLLIHYIACHGEGRWNLLAKCSGLKRTGKSCRLRWLNYLKPDVKRGNLTPEEQILILDLHSKWGNRWSRIAQHLPGRTDNEIKNYWRTRVQKQARQLKIDANSTLFRDALRCFWMPRLIEKMGCSSRQVLQFQSPNPIVNGDNNIPIQPPNPPTIMPNPTTTNQFQIESCSSSALSADALEIIAQLNGRPRDDHQVSGLMGGIMDGDDRQFMMRNELNEVIYGLGCLDYDSLPVVEPTAGDFGSRSVSNCSVMENYWIDHHNNMDDSLWSIWMNFSNS